ncbi:hypothetical protein APE_1219.1 [Aeropyrum pernix K1]|uniref:Uncharacterized protein n=1 Tax=Aeropyrum pernix (strain ATCC 700893 / DSM 11879 / JCM 9820 / NBRC 100138 / K1) TaxID=272557 RepID=Q9YCN9_AERPE|nr:hypothetical protein [Aeropyrum pernix]BAA80208.2 hypothetical protein APE_1219.1 [Aeropyrum pernix K1]
MWRGEAFQVKLSTAALPGIALGLGGGLLGVVLAPLAPGLHMGLVGLGLGLVFPLSMYIVFTGSLKSGAPRRGVEALAPVLAVSSAILSLLLYLAGLPWRPLAASALAFLGLHTLLQLVGWRRREPRWPLLYPPIAGAVSLALPLEGLGVVELMLRIGLYLDAPMILVVSLYTVARNYGRRPTSQLMAAVLAPNALALALAILGLGLHATLALAGLLAYYPALGLHRAPELLRRASRLPGPAGGTLRYMAASHLLTIPPMLLSLHPQATMLVKLHLLYIGFIGVHIILHAPLLLPQVARVKLSKNYQPIPPALLSAGAIVRAVAPDVSYIIVLAALAAAAVQFRPEGVVGTRGLAGPRRS